MNMCPASPRCALAACWTSLGKLRHVRGSELGQSSLSLTHQDLGLLLLAGTKNAPDLYLLGSVLAITLPVRGSSLQESPPSVSLHVYMGLSQHRPKLRLSCSHPVPIPSLLSPAAT